MVGMAWPSFVDSPQRDSEMESVKKQTAELAKEHRLKVLKLEDTIKD